MDIVLFKGLGYRFVTDALAAVSPSVPMRLLKTWTDQLTPDGLMLLEHTVTHASFNRSDPFGAQLAELRQFIDGLAPDRFHVKEVLTNAPGVTSKKGVHMAAKYPVVARR